MTDDNELSTLAEDQNEDFEETSAMSSIECISRPGKRSGGNYCLMKNVCVKQVCRDRFCVKKTRLRRLMTFCLKWTVAQW